MSTEKIDPHKHKYLFHKWQERGCPLKNLSKTNASLILAYLEDMRLGKNIAPGSKKGARGYGRLRNQKAKLQSIFMLMQTTLGKQDIRELTEDETLKFFNLMREGKVKSPRTRKKYTAPGIYVKAFKSFWHWFMRVQKREGKEVPDITADLDTSVEKPKFNYLTIEMVKRLCDMANFEYKALMMFLFDSGIRAPTELVNVRVSDLEYNEKEMYYTLNIRDEISKTFGRKIKLLLCSDILKQYITIKELKGDKPLFPIIPQITNRYLNRLGLRLNIGKPQYYTDKHGQKRVNYVKDGLTMYDFRHSSACYWLPRYKSEAALKYRFGWKQSEQIHYYTELLGMKDTLQKEDMYIDITKTELENEIEKLKKELALRDETHKAEIEKLQTLIANIRKEVIKLAAEELRKKGALKGQNT